MKGQRLNIVRNTFHKKERELRSGIQKPHSYIDEMIKDPERARRLVQPIFHKVWGELNRCDSPHAHKCKYCGVCFIGDTCPNCGRKNK